MAGSSTFGMPMRASAWICRCRLLRSTGRRRRCAGCRCRRPRGTRRANPEAAGADQQHPRCFPSAFASRIPDIRQGAGGANSVPPKSASTSGAPLGRRPASGLSTALDRGHVAIEAARFEGTPRAGASACRAGRAALRRRCPAGALQDRPVQVFTHDAEAPGHAERAFVRAAHVDQQYARALAGMGFAGAEVANRYAAIIADQWRALRPHRRARRTAGPRPSTSSASASAAARRRCEPVASFGAIHWLPSSPQRRVPRMNSRRAWFFRWSRPIARSGAAVAPCPARHRSVRAPASVSQHRNRIARQAEELRTAQLPSQQRYARLHPDLPEVHCAMHLQHRRDVILRRRIPRRRVITMSSSKPRPAASTRCAGLSGRVGHAVGSRPSARATAPSAVRGCCCRSRRLQRHAWFDPIRRRWWHRDGRRFARHRQAL